MNIFCYGALIYPDIWQHLVRSEYVAKDAAIRGYKCLRVKKESYPAVIRSSDDNSASDNMVPGKLYMNVNQEDFQRVQSHEGKQYDIIDGVCYVVDSEVKVDAKIFVWKSEHKGLLSEEHWHKEWFEEAALPAYRRKMNESLF